MDPFLECLCDGDFAAHFRVILRQEINDLLPKGLVARINGWEDRIPHGREGEEVRESWIEIREARGVRVYTVIELLTREYKTGEYFSGYIGRRGAWLSQPLDLVEIDLLLAGHHHALRRNERDVRYSVTTYYPVSWTRPSPNPGRWTIRDSLPRITVPCGDDDTIDIDLGKVFTESYDRAGCGTYIDYRKPLDLPLSEVDRQWVRDIALTAPQPLA